MNIKTEVISHREEIIDMLTSRMAVALEKIGIAGENNAKFEINALGAVDTGNLMNSISHTNDGERAYIGTNVEYAPYVELGTSHHPEERPFLRNAVLDYVDEYKGIVEDTLRHG